MDNYLSDYDNADQVKDNTGGVRYMAIEKKSVGIPDYQPLQQNSKSGKTLKHIQRNQKRMITVIVVLGLLILLVIIAGSTLVPIGWNKLTAKSESNYFQNCKRENTSCTLSKLEWQYYILPYYYIQPNCTTERLILHMKVSQILSQL